MEPYAACLVVIVLFIIVGAIAFFQLRKMEQRDVEQARLVGKPLDRD